MITEPMPFMEAIRFLLEKEQLPADWDAADWQAQEPDFQTKAFFSAKVENARFLDRAQGLIFDYMAKVRETIVQPDGTVVTALKVSGREQFVKRMRDFMIAEGMADFREFKDVDQKDIEDIRSLARLRLIFDTNVRQAYGFGQWKQGMTPAALKAFPAARLIRDRGVKEPRPRHQQNLGEVLLKTDPRWAEFHNAREIGGFGVPWGPYGFNSGVTQEDVSKTTARKLGLNVDSLKSQPAKVTDGTEASTKKMDPDIKAKLLAELRAGKKNLDPSDVARKAAADTRRIMLSRGLADAEGRGDAAKAAKYRKAIADLPDPGLKVRDDGDKIVLETSPKNTIVSLLPDDQDLKSNVISEPDGLRLSPSPLESAIDDIGRNARTTGEESFGLRQAAAIAQRDALVRWAEANGLKVDPSLWEGKTTIGGSEHDIWERDGEMWKVTRPDRFGWTVLPGADDSPEIAEATPLEYLERWQNANTLLGDLARLRGISQTDEGVQVVMSQPFIKGGYPSLEDIRHDMEKRGFVNVPGFSIGSEADSSYYNDKTRTGIFDAASDNYILSQGLPIPVDVILSRIGDKLRRQLLRLLNG